MKHASPSRLLPSLLLIALNVIAVAAPASTFVVTSTTDPGDGICNATCTLREAIAAANLTVAADTINFAIPTPITGELRITPATPLPTVTQPLTIDGYSQPGAAVNSHPTASNALIRIRISGTALPNGSNGLAVCAPNSIVRGISMTGFQSGSVVLFGVDSGDTPCAVGAANGSQLLGSFVGVAPDGSVGANPVSVGVDIFRSVVQVGGAALADRNVISSNAVGITLNIISTPGTTVLGNLMGWDPSGTVARGNSNEAITVFNNVSNAVIGTLAAPNRIGNNANGIVMASSSTSNTLFANEFTQNQGLGIDLVASGFAADGVTANDVDDADSGANGLQNFPTLTAVTRTATGLSVSGGVDRGGAGSKTFTIALYANATCDTNGNGEGAQFLGTFNFVSATPAVETFANVAFATTAALPINTRITATATDQTTGSTSEFSTCFNPDAGASTFVVTSTADTAGASCAAACTLRQAITAANAHAGADIISFTIPGAGAQTIIPATPLPTITGTLRIDGYTQPGSSVNTSPGASNATILVRISGTGVGSPARLLAVCAPDSLVRGLALTGLATGAAISFGVDAANVACATGAADNSRFVGNWVGVAPDGSASANTAAIAVESRGSSVQIGSSVVADRNVLSSSATGVLLNGGGASGSQVLGNLIGWDPTGVIARGNSNRGIELLAGPDNVRIGSDSAPNRIGNNLQGVEVLPGSTGVSTYANDIAQSSTIGIDLVATGNLADGVTANDADDPDLGGNNLQNFPVLTTIAASAGQLLVAGSLDVPAATANAIYTIAVYQNASCDPTGNGEGELYLGSADVPLSGNSLANEQFQFTLPVNPLANGAISATATDPAGNTSEFSLCLRDSVFRNGFE